MGGDLPLFHVAARNTEAEAARVTFSRMVSRIRIGCGSFEKSTTNGLAR